MADDATSSAISHGVALVAGGGASGVIMRLLFGGLIDRLTGIEDTLKKLVDKSDERHEKLIERIGAVEAQAAAAHRRLDEMKGRRR